MTPTCDALCCRRGDRRRWFAVTCRGWQRITALYNVDALDAHAAKRGAHSKHNAAVNTVENEPTDKRSCSAAQDVARAEKALKDVLEKDPPLGVRVEFELKKSGSGSQFECVDFCFTGCARHITR